MIKIHYCCEDVKSHRSGGDTVPLSLGHSLENLVLKIARKIDPYE